MSHASPAPSDKPAVDTAAGERPPGDPAAERPAAPPRRQADRGAGPLDRSFASEAWDFIARVAKKIEQDNVMFLGGAIAFKVLIAIVPLILATLGIAGLLIQSRFGATAAQQVRRAIIQAIPPIGPEVQAALDNALREILGASTGFLGVGMLVLIWLATSLIGTLRTVLREIFDLQEDRGMVRGKFFDIQMVFAAGTLLAINVVLTVVLEVVASLGTDFFGLDPARFEWLDRVLVGTAAIGSVWFMFVLIYRYLPSRRIPWRIAMISATFTTLLFELLKAGFGWYVTSVAFYRSTYGNFATVIVFFLWIYYMSVAFILGGQVGQVAALTRIRRRQKERLR
ncbi:MAG: YihY/virulence factor BrkB family protein [Gemmatimonadetes bacterium]|nr:YihY/virulence factor BrkB family protein [Gemmatimonadota bacterium]